MAENQEITQTTQEQTTDRYEIKHLGFGRYEVNGEKFTKGVNGAANKAAAEQRVQELKSQDELDEVIGDVLPEGYADFQVTDRPYHYRGSILELAMNEPYAPDGSFNKYYDREWRWLWAALDQTDISDKQAKGYKLVDIDTLEKGVKDDRYPEHILSMVRAEGSYLVHGDLVLMRMPRTLWRQQKAAREEAVLRRMRKQDKDQRDYFADRGVGVRELPVSNELRIR